MTKNEMIRIPITITALRLVAQRTVNSQPFDNKYEELLSGMLPQLDQLAIALPPASPL
jgi:hypothetical protein